MADFTMPSLGADMDEGTLLEWLVHPGDVVRKGDVLAVVDTSKSAVEVESFHTGVVGPLLVEPGTTVPVGTVLATITEAGAAPPEAPVPEPVAAAPKPKRARKPRHQRAAAPAAPPAAATEQVRSPSSGATRRGWAWTSATCTAPARAGRSPATTYGATATRVRA